MEILADPVAGAFLTLAIVCLFFALLATGRSFDVRQFLNAILRSWAA
jgi:hypothetical protein